MRSPLKQINVMRLWLTPGMGVKRHVALAALGTLIMIFGVVGGALWLLAGNRQVISEPIEGFLVSRTWLAWGIWLIILTILSGLCMAVIAIARLNRSLLSNWMPHPKDAAIVLHKRLSLSKGPHIMAIGGGSGLSNLLRGLRHHTSNITAAVTVSDDGGSSGRLRSAFNMPAPGDLSDCLAALSDNELEVSRLLQYRFHRGNELAGHTFGNLLITTLTEVEGDFARAIRVLNSLLNLTGFVYPITPEPIALKALKTSGEWVKGESNVRKVKGAISKVVIEPNHPIATPEVINGILSSDMVVLGPGSLFTSTIPPLLVPAVRRALLQTSAKIIYVCNIMTEAGETDHFSAFDHVKALFSHLGRYPDTVVLNSSSVDERRVQSYQQENAHVVSFHADAFAKVGVNVVSLPLLGVGPHAQHDSMALALWLCENAKTSPTPATRKKVAML